MWLDLSLVTRQWSSTIRNKIGGLGVKFIIEPRWYLCHAYDHFDRILNRTLWVEVMRWPVDHTFSDRNETRRPAESLKSGSACRVTLGEKSWGCTKQVLDWYSVLDHKITLRECVERNNRYFHSNFIFIFFVTHNKCVHRMASVQWMAISTKLLTLW